MLAVHPLTPHRQEYMFTVEGEISPGSFDYGEKETMQLIVHKIVRDPRDNEPRTILTQEDLVPGENSEEYTIHAGYRRVLLGFLREVDMLGSGEVPVNEYSFRGRYIVKVLDSFVKELELHRKKPRSLTSPGVGTTSTAEEPHLFRSQVLNPILQRQLCGIYDNEPETVRRAVGASIEAAECFYLTLDPLHPDLARRMLKNLLYVWPVRLSLAFYSRQGTKASFNNTLINTSFLVQNRSKYPTDAWDKSMLYDFEVETIRKESLEDVYRLLIEASVSGGSLFRKYFL